MVWPNPFDSEKSELSLSRSQSLSRIEFKHTYHYVSPKTRLAAVVADSVLLIPLFALVTAPLKRQFQASILYDGAQPHIGWMLQAALLVIGVGIFIQTALIAYFGTTPGKFVLGLRVVSRLDTKKPTFMQAFLRSLFWWLSVILFGAPFFSVSRHPSRRCWYDRIADTDVVARQSKAHVASIDTSRPETREANQAAFVQMILMTAAVYTLGTVGSRWNAYDREQHQKAQERISAKGLASQCGFSQWAIADVVSYLIAIESDLSLLSDQSSRAREFSQRQITCLGKLIEWHIWSNDDGPLIHFAKGLKLQLEGADGSERYFGRVCEIEPDSSECRWISRSESWDSTGRGPTSIPSKLSAELGSAWKQFERDRLPLWLGYALASEYRKKILQAKPDRVAAQRLLQLTGDLSSGPHELAQWLQRLRIEAFRALGRIDDVNRELDALIRLSSKDDARRASAWVCGHTVQSRSCLLQTKACSIEALESAYSTLSQQAESDLALVGATRSVFCQFGDSDPRRVKRELTRLKDKAVSSDHIGYLNALMSSEPMGLETEKLSPLFRTEMQRWRRHSSQGEL